jgi:hypothetical protein
MNNSTLSYYVTAQGGPDLGRWAKKKALFLARVVTDDAEFPLAMVLRNDEKNRVRIVACVGSMRHPPTANSPHKGSEWGIGPLKFQHISVERARISEMVKLS